MTFNPCKKPVKFKSPDYQKFIKNKPCVICGRKSNFHHEGLNAGKKGVGTKVSDSQGVPLCPECHTIGTMALHRMGSRMFWEVHNIDVKMLIIGYLTEYLQCLTQKK
jgi:hypothetical protein